MLGLSGEQWLMIGFVALVVISIFLNKGKGSGGGKSGGSSGGSSGETAE